MLLALLLSTSALAAHHDFSNGYSASYSLIDCSITISANNTVVFQSDQYLLKTGSGNVDDVTIMVAGNVENFPKPEKFSSHMLCLGAVETQLGFTVQGEIALAEEEGLTIPFDLAFTADGAGISFNATVPLANSNGNNFLSFNVESQEDEEIYGLGLQYTRWNFKGHKVPLIVEEGGIGRGLEPISFVLNEFGHGQGGSPTTSYGANPNILSSKNRGILFEPLEIGIADFTDEETISMLFWHATNISGWVHYGPDPVSLVKQQSSYIGRMPMLPDWVFKGSVIGAEGGQVEVDGIYAKLKAGGVKLAGVWMQDWVGLHEFPEGKRLLWNWQLNRDWYYDWDNMTANWALDDVRPLVYFNPYIANLTDFAHLRSNQFQEGVENEYFVKNSTGDPYLIQSLSISFAMVDFTNPEAYKWFGQILKANGVVEAGAIGWMHDFGEYLPFDAVLYSGVSPYEYHNTYPYDWGRVAADYVGTDSEVLWFQRSASLRSPQHARSYWMGDQLTSWDYYDGLQSALIGQLNSGLSGFSFGHSDIGGYTSTKYAGIQFYKRSNDLLLRWIEMNTFADAVMRSHPGNQPTVDAQIWDSEYNIQFFKNFTDIHVALGGYKKQLAQEAASSGLPLARALLLHFYHDKTARGVYDQFLLGESILVAPIHSSWLSYRNIYLPGPATWTHIWSNETYIVSEGKDLFLFYAPMGQPAVFVRDSEGFNAQSFITTVWDIFGLH